MTVIKWDSLRTAADWQATLATLRQDAAQAKAGSAAERQAVAQNLQQFWQPPYECPFTEFTKQARLLYSDLLLVDLGQGVTQAPGPQPLAAVARPTGQHLLRALATLQKQHRQHLAAQLAIEQQLEALRQAVERFLREGPPPAPASRRRKPPRSHGEGPA